MLISNILGSKAFNITTAQDLGEINSITYRDSKISYLCTTLGYCFKTADIVAINNVITCSTCYEVTNLPDQAFPSNNANIITTSGKLVGELQDLMVNRDFKLTKLICSTKNLAKFEIKSYSLSAIIINATERGKKQTEKQCECDNVIVDENDILDNSTQNIQQPIQSTMQGKVENNNQCEKQSKCDNMDCICHNNHLTINEEKNKENLDDLQVNAEQKQELINQIMQNQTISNSQISINTNSNTNNNFIESTIPSIVANYEFLLGRTIFKNILSPTGSLLFACGHIITRCDIDKAKHLGKLVQLTLYSKPIKIQ